MAVTKIWAVKNRIDHVVDYTKDETKTRKKNDSNECFEDLPSVYDYVINSNKTEKQFYVTGINCDDKNAVHEMNEIKDKYNKPNGILAFHGIQSFKKGEITPKLAHELGVKLAEEMWGDRFQVVVSTHLNTKCLHNHFVLNSVSFTDGYKYYSNCENTAKLRSISDDLCREYGLSVIENPKSKKIDFDYFYKKGFDKDEYNSFVKEDIDFAIKRAFSFEEFKKILKVMGYEYYFRAEQMSIRMPPRKMYLRVERNFGEEYSIQRIKERIFDDLIDMMAFYRPEYKTSNCKYYSKKKNIVKVNISGITGLYRYYCYILNVYPKRNWQYKLSYENRKAIKELHHFTDKLTFATQNKIVTLEDVENIRKVKKEDLQDAYNYRNKLYYARGKTENKEQFVEKIAQVTAYISKLKYELKMCYEIEDEISKMIEQIKEKDNRENNFDKKTKNNTSRWLLNK